MKIKLIILAVVAYCLPFSMAAGADNTPPEGFTALFNGKDLTGWKGLVADPPKRAKMSPDELAAAQAKEDAATREHWKAEDGVLVFDGKGKSLCTAKDYGNFELMVDWKILPLGDSGIYLRGTPQVQIWDIADTAHGGQVGSGGLYNNQKNPKDPLAVADKPIGEWNHFLIKLVGDKVTVHLNDKLVTDNVTLENFWERDKPLYPTRPDRAAKPRQYAVFQEHLHQGIARLALISAPPWRFLPAHFCAKLCVSHFPRPPDKALASHHDIFSDGQTANLRRHQHRDAREPAFSAAGRVRQPSPASVRWPPTRRCGTKPPPTFRSFGENWPASCIGSSRTTKCSSGTSRLPSWFVGGKTNASYNCLDAHLSTWRKNKAAIICEGEPGDKQTLHLPAAASRGVQVRQRAQEPGDRRKGTSSRSTCRWCPSW